MNSQVKVFESLESTNITLSGMADNGAAEGTCVVAFSQTAGQGRSGRKFYSPDGGNLYMSLLLRPRDGKKTSMITTMAAVAVCDAVKESFGIDAGIKWVNDIIFCGRKVCGIVAQAHNFGKSDQYVILGIGINIYDAKDVPEELAGRYGSLMRKEPDIDKEEQNVRSLLLAQSIIDHFAVYYESVDPGSHMRQYERRCIVIGKTVEYVWGDRTVSAKCVGIDKCGGIILEKDGARQTYNDGEIRIASFD